MSREGTGTLSTEFLTGCGDRLLDVDEVLEDLRAIVAEKGAGYRYRQDGDDRICTYLNQDGSPSCIVGHVAARRGWLDLGTIQSNEALEADEYGSLPVTPAAHEVLRVAQEVQDARVRGDAEGPRRTWGEALAAAEAIAEQL
jgi:hypothetical protein